MLERTASMASVSTARFGSRASASTVVAQSARSRPLRLNKKTKKDVRRKGVVTQRPVQTCASSSAGSKVAQQGSYRAANLPDDESDLLAQIHTSVQAALTDGKVLLDVEVPVSYFSGVVVREVSCLSER